MRSDQERLKRVAAYLSGQLEAAEKDDLEQWISASPEHQRMFEEASRIWENSGMKLRLPVDETDRLWLELKSRMDRSQKVFSLFGMSVTTLKVAASVILVSLITYFLWPSPSREAATIADNVSISSGDHVATLYLPDSSRVWLNVNSRLSYAKDFGGQTGRRASLEGEAFFEITPDQDSPFTVAAQGTSVTVVGTAFNLRQQGDDVTLTVSEGEVLFSGDDEEKIPVTAGEKAVSADGGELTKSKNDDAHFEAWRRASNPEFEKEKLNPAAYLTARYTWRKNAINQSVIEGTLTSKATLAAYSNVVLKVSYRKPNGTRHTVRVKIDDTVKAGARVAFQKRLFDIFTNTRSLEVEIESAAVATSVY